MRENDDNDEFNDYDEFNNYRKSRVLSRKISPNIELKLENNQTNVYIAGKYVKTCMDVKIIIPRSDLEQYDSFNSIDEISELANNSDFNDEYYSISPEEEFMGHCSNLQAWYENDYDPRLLHSNIAFPLLRHLAIIGDSLARNVFKRVIIERFLSGEKVVTLFLLENNYLDYLDEFETQNLIESVKINFAKFKIFEFKDFVDLWEEFFLEMGYDTRRLFLMNNLNEISNFIAKLLSEYDYDNMKIHLLYESLNRLMSFLIRYERRFFDYGVVNYRLKKHFSNDAIVEIRNDTNLYLKNKNQNFYTETNFSYSYDKFRVFLDFRAALFGVEDLIFSNISNMWVTNFDSFLVEVIHTSKKVREVFSANFTNLPDWFELKHKIINQFTNFDKIELDFVDKVHYIYLILWNLLCRLPKEKEIRFIKQSDFFYEIIEFYNTKDCDVSIKIYNNNLRQNRFEYSSQNKKQKFFLIVKNRNEQFYRRYEDNELHDIIKSLFFRDEKLEIDAVFWIKHHQVFEISVEFDSLEINKNLLEE